MSDKLRQAARKVLFEDVWPRYGSEPMSHPFAQGGTPVPDSADSIAYGEVELPVEPSDLMPNRIAIEKPPVDDEEYSPVNPIELSKAMAAIGEEIPDSKVEDFYNSVKREFETIQTLAVEDEDEEPTEEEEEEEADEAELESQLVGTSGNMETYVGENKIRKIIRDMLLNEQISDWSQFKAGTHYGPDVDDEPEDWELEAIKSGDASAGESTGQSTKGEIKGKHVAKYWNKAGPSGVTVGMQRLFQNYLQHIGEVDTGDIQDATDYISYHFVELDPEFNDPEVLRTLRTYIFKKVVKDALKADKDIQQNFLSDIVSYVKGLRKKNMESLLQKARSEVSNEKKSNAEFIEYLEKEEPEQYQLFLDMFPSYAQ